MVVNNSGSGGPGPGGNTTNNTQNDCDKYEGFKTISDVTTHLDNGTTGGGSFYLGAIPNGTQHQFISTYMGSGVVAASSNNDVIEFTEGLSTEPGGSDVRWTYITKKEGTSTLTMTWDCGDSGKVLTTSFDVTVTPPLVKYLSLESSNEYLVKGYKGKLTLYAVYSDGITRDITDTAVWTYDNTYISIDETAGNEGVITVHTNPASEGSYEDIYAALPSNEMNSNPYALSQGNFRIRIYTDAYTADKVYISQSSTVLPKGKGTKFQASASFSNGGAPLPPVDVTLSATWSVSSGNSVTVDNSTSKGEIATTANSGSADVQVAVGGKSTTSTVEVKPTLSSIEVSPAILKVQQGLTLQLKAVGNYSNNDYLDITDLVTWSSTDTSVVEVSNETGKEGLVTAKASGVASINIAGPDSVNTSESIRVIAPPVDRIEIKPVNAFIKKGENISYKVTAIYEDGTFKDITKLTSFSSSDFSTAVPAVQLGTFLGRNAGKSKIKASYFAGGQPRKTVETRLTVKAPTLTKLEVSPPKASLVLGTSNITPLMAIAHFDDNSTEYVTELAHWVSSDDAVAIVKNLEPYKGHVEAKSDGIITITAEYEKENVTKTATAEITVKDNSVSISRIEMTSNESVLTASTTGDGFGQKTYVKVMAVYSDNSTRYITYDDKLVFSSSDTNKAKISNDKSTKGMVTALASTSGSTINLTASYPGVTDYSIPIEVQEPNLTQILIEPAVLDLMEGQQDQLSAIGYFDNGTTRDLTLEVEWKSNSKGVSISNDPESKGLVTGVFGGVVNIQAKFKDTTSFTSSVTVRGMEGSKSEAEVDTTADVESTPIIPTPEPDPVTLSYLQIDAQTIRLPIGTSAQFKATAFYSDNSSVDVTDQVLWSSADSADLAISNDPSSKGRATALQKPDPYNKVVLTAAFTVKNETTDAVTTKTADIGVWVNSAIMTAVKIDVDNPNIPKGTDVEFKATGFFSDGTTQNRSNACSWVSSDNGKLQRLRFWGSYNRFRASTTSTGAVTLTVNCWNINDSVTLNIVDATLNSIYITPGTHQLVAGFKKQFKATGVFSDYTSKDLTDEVLWTVSDNAKARVSNQPDGKGLVTTLAAGDIDITATYKNDSGTAGVAKLNISEETLSSIEVTTSKTSLAEGLSLAFTAIGHYSNGNKRDITSQVSWKTSNAAVAQMDSTRGMVKAISAGSADITAYLYQPALSDSFTLSVTAAALVSIDISPDNVSLPDGRKQAFSATGTYTDGSVVDITAQTSWSSPQDCTHLSMADGSIGVATARSDSCADGANNNITASLDGVIASTNVQATAATLSSYTISQSFSDIPLGLDRQFKATATYSDASTLDITDEVSWYSNNFTIAAVSNDKLNKGRVYTVAEGSTVIKACLKGETCEQVAVTVSAETVNSLTITLGSTSLGKGEQTTLQVIANWSSSGNLDVTRNAVWEVDDKTKSNIIYTERDIRELRRVGVVKEVQDLSVSGINWNWKRSGKAYTKTKFVGTKKWVTVGTERYPSHILAKDNGSVTVTATYKGVTATETLNIGSPSVASIIISPATANINSGTQSYSATAVMTDGTTESITGGTWSIANFLGTPGNTIDSGTGEVSYVGTGVSKVTLTYSGKTGDAYIATDLASITMNPASSFTAYFDGRFGMCGIKFVATGNFGGPTYDLSNIAEWSSNNNCGRMSSFYMRSACLSTTADSVIIKATMGSIEGVSTGKIDTTAQCTAP